MTITYSLAIVKVALQLQAHELPRFDNLLDTIHAFLLYVKESGSPYVLTEGGVIALNSASNFLKSLFLFDRMQQVRFC